MWYSVESVVFLGVWLFIITHIDTLVVMGAFCADNDYRIWEVFVGHYVGFSLGLAAAVIASILAAELFHGWTFVLGIVPLSIGMWGLIRRPPESTIEHYPSVPNAFGRVSVVTMSAIGLSGENIAVFIPFFVELSARELTVMIVVYLIGAGLVFLTAFLMVYRFALDGVSDRVDRWLVPSVLVVIGLYVILTGLFVT